MARSAPVMQVTRLLLACLLALGFTLAAWSWVEVDRPFATVHVTGSLERVNAGQVSPWDLSRIDTAGVIGGFGAGTQKKIYTTGEMLSFCGRTFIRTTNLKGAPKVVEVTGTPFNSPFALMIKPVPTMTPQGLVIDEVFPRTYRVKGDEPQLLHSVLETLAVEANSPVAVIGWVEMADVDGSALKKAPIFDKPLSGERKDEFVESIRKADTNVVFFSVVSPVLSLPPVANTLLTRHAFDFNPEQGLPAAALIHAHGALVNEPVPIPNVITAPFIMDGLKSVTVTDILHIYGTSTIRKGAFLVYRLQYP